RALPRVLRQERRPHAAAIEFGIGAELACKIAGAEHFDLDHFGAELRQLIAAERAGKHVGQIEHPRRREKSSHPAPACSVQQNIFLRSIIFCTAQQRSTMFPNRATEPVTGMSKDKVEAVERALAVLNAFHADKPTMTLGEIASATGFYKSTILRLAGSLERLGYLIR